MEVYTDFRKIPNALLFGKRNSTQLVSQVLSDVLLSWACYFLTGNLEYVWKFRVDLTKHLS